MPHDFPPYRDPLERRYVLPARVTRHNIHEVLVYFRQLQGCTQQRMSRRLNCSRSTMGRFETGEAKPTIARVIDYLDELGLTLVVVEKEPEEE